MSQDHGVVFIIDDDPSVRESLNSLFRSVGHVVHTFESALDFLDRERPNDSACIVLDVRLPGPSGLEFQRQLAGLGIHIPVVFITGHGDVPMSVSAMKAGAIEFLTKPFRDQDLLDAVHRGIELDRECKKDQAVLNDLQDRYDALTLREQEIMALVVLGQLNKQIAFKLDLSEVTIKAHRAQVMRKMKARTLPDLVRFADRLNSAILKQ
ncbi:response regulator transcription factor [Sneathiella sp.]|uniref:response regulator transcription factor n=1 Tax=Sneathiella sp. TaxID=1964365 RepID=UPI003563A480